MIFIKKYFLHIILFFVLPLLFISCKYGFEDFFHRENGLDKRIGPITDYTVDSIPESQTEIKAMIITDTQFGAKSGDLAESAFFESVKLKEPDMILILGDIVEHGHESEYQEYKAFIDRIPLVDGGKIPVYCAVGNHDLYNSGWDLYRKYTTPDSNFFRLKTGDVSWYFVDSAGGTLGTTQLNILETEMLQDPNYKFVFSHYPFYGDKDLPYFSLGNPRERAFLLNLCAKTNVQGIYSGHFHIGGDHDFGPFHEKVVNSLRGFRNTRQGWLMLVVDLSEKSYIQEKYMWTGGDQYTTSSIKRYF